MLYKNYPTWTSNTSRCSVSSRAKSREEPTPSPAGAGVPLEVVSELYARCHVHGQRLACRRFTEVHLKLDNDARIDAIVGMWPAEFDTGTTEALGLVADKDVSRSIDANVVRQKY